MQRDPPKVIGITSNDDRAAGEIGHRDNEGSIARSEPWLERTRRGRRSLAPVPVDLEALIDTSWGVADLDP